MASNDRNAFSYHSESQKSNIKVLAEHASSGDAEEESFAGFLWLLAIFGGFLACSCICPILPPHSHGLFTYICLHIYKYPSPYQDTSHGFGAHPCLISIASS